MSEQETNQGSSYQTGAGEAVRQAFASLPFGEKISTLLKVEWDMIEEAAETIVTETSKALDEIADAVVGKSEGQADQSRL